MMGFGPGGFPCRDDADDIADFPFTVANDEQIGVAAHAKHDEPVFLPGVRVIEKLNGEFIVENGFRLLERNAMLLEVGVRLGRIPFKFHLYIVLMVARDVNRPQSMPLVARGTRESMAI